jgi:predicted LPLAT superfamily acyltransferase
MSSWQGKTRGGVAGYKIFVWTLKHLGLSFAYFLLYFVVIYYFLTSGKAFRFIYRFYRRRMNYGKVRSVISIYRNYYVFGQVILDKIAMLAGFQYKFTFDFEGEEHLRMMERGGLLVSAHMGNWEIAGHLLNRLEKRINIILYDAEHRQIRQYLSDVLSTRKVNFIIIREDYSHLQEIRDAFSRGEIVAMHGDRYIEGNKVMMIDFLGEPAPFPVGPVNLAARFAMPVSYVFAMKQSPTHYHFYATPLRTVGFPHNLKERDPVLKEALEAYVGMMEKIIRDYPLQWFNYYDFWKLPPAGTQPAVP